MKRFFLLLILFPIILFSFEPRPITPYPVVGFRLVQYNDQYQKINRNIHIWYPVDPEVTGSASSNPWDIFNVAVNAPPATSNGKMPIILLSHGYLGSPDQLSWLTRGLVHAGFIVVGIQHRDLLSIKYWQRPLDIRTMIDIFSTSPLADAADMNK